MAAKGKENQIKEEKWSELLDTTALIDLPKYIWKINAIKNR